MQIPESIRLGGHEIRILREDLSRVDAAGFCHWDKKEIVLAPHLDGTALVEVLIHECAHMVSDAYDLHLTEQQVRTLGVGLQQMLAPFLRTPHLAPTNQEGL